MRVDPSSYTFGDALLERKTSGSSRYGEDTVASQDETTLGWSIFRDGIYGGRTLSDIHDQIELKYATCLSMGGNGGYPIDISQIRNPLFRQIAGAAASLKGWSLRDLTECVGRLAVPSEGVLIASLENPLWGEDDVHVFRLIQRIEAYQSKAEGGGRAL